MQRLWKIAALMLTLTLMPSIAQAEDPELTTEKRLKQLENQMKGMQGKLDTMIMLQILKELQSLNDRVTRMELQMNGSRPSVTTSKFPPIEEATGTLRLDNRSALTATILVNNIEYRLPPNTVQTLKAFPVGDFTYQVDVEQFGTIRPRVSRSLTENQTFRITVYP